jgi:hypothetical protein
MDESMGITATHFLKNVCYVYLSNALARYIRCFFCTLDIYPSTRIAFYFISSVCFIAGAVSLSFVHTLPHSRAGQSRRDCVRFNAGRHVRRSAAVETRIRPVDRGRSEWAPRNGERVYEREIERIEKRGREKKGVPQLIWEEQISIFLSALSMHCLCFL